MNGTLPKQWARRGLRLVMARWRLPRARRSVPQAGRGAALAMAALGCAALAGLALWSFSSGPAAGDDGVVSVADAPSVLVQTTSLRRGSLPRIVTGYGTVLADSSGRATIVAPADAVIGQVNVRTGEEVAAGARLVRLQPTAPNSAAYAQAQSALRVATEGAVHTRELLGEHLATRQQLADAEKAESDARATLAALRAQGAGGPLTLRAPFRGIVTAVSASTHAQVTQGTALVELASARGLVLTIGVAPNEAGMISAGDPVRVTGIGTDQSYSGRVLSRGALVEAASGLVPVRVAVPPGMLLPGESAQASITVGEISGYVVPHEAVLVDEQGSPYVVQAVQGTAKLVHVQILGSSDDSDTISGPLAQGAPLVLAGNYQAQDGMKVRLANPSNSAGSANPDPGAR